MKSVKDYILIGLTIGFCCLLFSEANAGALMGGNSEGQSPLGRISSEIVTDVKVEMDLNDKGVIKYFNINEKYVFAIVATPILETEYDNFNQLYYKYKGSLETSCIPLGVGKFLQADCSSDGGAITVLLELEFEYLLQYIINIDTEKTYKYQVIDQKHFFPTNDGDKIVLLGVGSSMPQQYELVSSLGQRYELCGNILSLDGEIQVFSPQWSIEYDKVLQVSSNNIVYLKIQDGSYEVGMCALTGEVLWKRNYRARPYILSLNNTPGVVMLNVPGVGYEVLSVNGIKLLSIDTQIFLPVYDSVTENCYAVVPISNVRKEDGRRAYEIRGYNVGSMGYFVADLPASSSPDYLLYSDGIISAIHGAYGSGEGQLYLSTIYDISTLSEANKIGAASISMPGFWTPIKKANGVIELLGYDHNDDLSIKRKIISATEFVGSGEK